MFDEWFPPRYPERKRVVVNTKDGTAIQGILWEKGREYLKLKSARLLAENVPPIPIDGDCIIFRSEVLFLQVLYGVEQ